jgi:hypothetical protein
MRLSDRLKVMAVLYAITALGTGILDAFVHIEMLDYLLFHSALFHIALFAAFLILAPLVVRIFGLKLGRTSNASEGA